MRGLLAPNTFSFCSSVLDFDKYGKKGDRIAAELMTIGGEYYLAGSASDYLHERSGETTRTSMSSRSSSSTSPATVLSEAELTVYVRSPRRPAASI